MTQKAQETLDPWSEPGMTKREGGSCRSRTSGRVAGFLGTPNSRNEVSEYWGKNPDRTRTLFANDVVRDDKAKGCDESRPYIFKNLNLFPSSKRSIA